MAKQLIKLKDLPIGSTVRELSTKFKNTIIDWTIIDKNHTGYPINSVQLQMSNPLMSLEYVKGADYAGSPAGALADYITSDIHKFLTSNDATIGHYNRAIVNINANIGSSTFGSYSTTTAYAPSFIGQPGFLYGISSWFKSKVKSTSVPQHRLSPLSGLVSNSSVISTTIDTPFFLLSAHELVRSATGLPIGYFFEYFNTPGNNKGAQNTRTMESDNVHARKNTIVNTNGTSTTNTTNASNSPLLPNYPVCSFDNEVYVYPHETLSGIYVMNIIPQATITINEKIYPKVKFTIIPSILNTQKIEIVMNGDVIQTYTDTFTSQKEFTLPDLDNGEIIDTVNIIVYDANGDECGTKTLKVNKYLTYEESTFSDMEKEHTSLETSFTHSSATSGFATVKLDITSTSVTKDGRIKRILGGLN